MKRIIIILTLLALAAAILIAIKKPVDDYRFFSAVFNQPVVKGELVKNEAMAAVVDDGVIGINVYPNKLEGTEVVEKIIKKYSPLGKSGEIIRAFNDSCNKIKTGNYIDGEETYKHEKGNIYIRTWSNYGGTVYILIGRGAN